VKVLIITGSREGLPRDRRDLLATLTAAIKAADLVIHGGARGVDALADQLARRSNVHVAVVNALWEQRKRAAGSDRNSVLASLGAKLQRGGAEVSYGAYPGPESHGTWDCVRKLKAVNIAGEVHQ
jgi:hypothetical protein